MLEIGGSFGFRNFKSVNNSGVILEKLNKINILIGKNNSGKSNVLAFLKLLREKITVNARGVTFPVDIINQHRRNGLSPELIIAVDSDAFLDIIKGNSNFRSEYWKYSIKMPEKIEFSFALNGENKILFDSFLENLPSSVLLQLQTQYSDAQQSSLLKAARDNFYNFFYSKVISRLPKIIYIPNFRYIQEGNKIIDSNSSIDGSNIISKMFEMQNPSIGKEKEKDQFLAIEDFVKELLNTNNLKIEIPHTKDNIIIELYGNRLPLSSFGTGIHQLVLLCSAIVTNKDAVICIEEPEIHLHPELQRKFLTFIEEKTNNLYFLTTHSNVFLEYSKFKSIYHVQYNGESTSIQKTINDEDTNQILIDLGYKQSDLLQANGIIWVEGPSDRIYLKKWLSYYGNYIEGVHYSIMFYGGRLLSHLSFKPDLIDETVIPLLKINRNAFILIDKDAKRISDKLNKTKERIVSEIGESCYWITKGREIENYLAPEIVSRWLSFRFNKSIRYHSDYYQKIEDQIQKSLNGDFDYSAKKAFYAKEIVEHFSPEYLNVLDLDVKLKLIINKIKEWNDLSC